MFIFGVIGALSLWDHLSGRSKKRCPYCHKQLDKGVKNTSSDESEQDNNSNTWFDDNDKPIFNKSEWLYLSQVPEVHQAYTTYRRTCKTYLNDWKQILENYSESSQEYQIGKSVDKQITKIYQDVHKVVCNDSVRNAIVSASMKGETAKDLYKDAMLMVVDKLNKASESTSALHSKMKDETDALKDAEVKDLVAQWQQSRTTSHDKSPDITPADIVTEKQELVDLSDAFDAMVQEDEQIKKSGVRSTIDEDLWDTENQSAQKTSV